MRFRRMLAAVAALGAMAGPAWAGGDASQVARGKYLVAAGDCTSCHTAEGGGYMAGGVALHSPFGVMYSPNLTPDKATGIGNWSDDDFYRAMHEGRDDEGHFLYPALPYPWFTKVTRDDVDAIKAYLFSLPPVNAPQKQDHLMFPLNIRPVMFGWNTMFFHPGTFAPDASKSAAYNRGAYLVEGLGHCSDCHTPKNLAQAPVNSRAYAGGVIDGWYAPNISSDAKEGLGGWSDDELFHYLKTGIDPKKGVVLGPMKQAIDESLSKMTDADLRAIVTYIKAVPPQQSYKPQTPVLASDQRPGAAVYVTYCASCHQQNGQGVKGRIPALADNGAVTAKGPENVIRVVIGGLPAQASYGPMPGFGAIMSDQQIADVTNYVRSAWSNTAPAGAGPGDVDTLAKETKTVLSGTLTCPAPGNSPLQKALADPAGKLQPLLAAANEENLTQSANKIAAALRAAGTGEKQADLVNETADAYCAVLAGDASLSPVQRWERLNAFDGALYTQMVEHGKS